MDYIRARRLIRLLIQHAWACVIHDGRNTNDDITADVTSFQRNSFRIASRNNPNLLAKHAFRSRERRNTNVKCSWVSRVKQIWRNILSRYRVIF